MDLASSEAVVRLTAFVTALTLLAAVEAAAPRRRRAVARSHRWLGNLGLVLVDTIAVRAAPFVSVVAMAGLAKTRGWGLLQVVGPVPAWLGIAASALLLDLAIYLQHVLFHALPALWRLHRVHHTDPELDVTTGVRFHPVEILLSAGFKRPCKAAISSAREALSRPCVGYLFRWSADREQWTNQAKTQAAPPTERVRTAEARSETVPSAITRSPASTSRLPARGRCGQLEGGSGPSSHHLKAGHASPRSSVKRRPLRIRH